MASFLAQPIDAIAAACFCPRSGSDDLLDPGSLGRAPSTFRSSRCDRARDKSWHWDNDVPSQRLKLGRVIPAMYSKSYKLVNLATE